LITFSEGVRVNFMDQPHESLQKITHGDYRPGGGTALYDAIGYMIDHFSALPEASDPNCSFLLVIVTDGEENSSRHWNYARVRESIQSLEKTGRWTFTYLGAAEGLQDVGASLGIQVGNTMSGINLRAKNVYAAVASSSMDSFMSSRLTGQSAVNSFYSGANTGAEDDEQDKLKTTTTTAKTGQKQGTS
jgi:hypothetical protein